MRMRRDVRTAVAALVLFGAVSSFCPVMAEAGPVRDWIARIWNRIPGGGRPCSGGFAVLEEATRPLPVDPRVEYGPSLILVNRDGRSYAKANKLRMMDEMIEKVRREVPERGLVDLHLVFALENPYSKAARNGDIASVKSFEIAWTGRKDKVLAEMTNIRGTLARRGKPAYGNSAAAAAGAGSTESFSELLARDPEGARALERMIGRPVRGDVPILRTSSLEGLGESESGGEGIDALLESRFVGLVSSKIRYQAPN